MIGPGSVCPICRHGEAPSEVLAADGACQYQVIAVAENRRVADARVQAEIERVTRAPWHLRPGART